MYWAIPNPLPITSLPDSSVNLRISSRDLTISTLLSAENQAQCILFKNNMYVSTAGCRWALTTLALITNAIKEMLSLTICQVGRIGLRNYGLAILLRNRYWRPYCAKTYQTYKACFEIDDRSEDSTCLIFISN